MNYKLTYRGEPGAIRAMLLYNGATIATASDLKDKKAVEKWADQQARDHKVENTPEATADHYVEVSGEKTFTL